MNLDLSILSVGFFTGLSLIVAIGAQNAFILRQGLLKQNLFIVVTICALSDALLILAGVYGSARIIHIFPAFTDIMRWGGAAFLLVYGIKSAVSAYKGEGQLKAQSDHSSSAVAAALTCLALTWLNPHVYLDTVVLIGAISAEFAPNQSSFAFGAVSASLIFFSALGYGARYLAPLFAKKRAWQILDALIALVMWSIAISLIVGK